MRLTKGQNEGIDEGVLRGFGHVERGINSVNEYFKIRDEMSCKQGESCMTGVNGGVYEGEMHLA